MKDRLSVEQYVYLFLLVSLFLAQVFVGTLLVRLFPGSEAFRDASFGFNQFAPLGLRGILPWVLLFIVILLLWRRIKPLAIAFFTLLEAKSWRFHTFAWSMAILSVLIFFVFSTNFINQDGRRFERKFNRDVPLFGAHVTHDEMWELFFHSRLWFYTNQQFGWDVPFVYRVVSSVIGGFFVLALLYYAHQKRTEGWLGHALLICSGGYIQLFFGDVENYTMTALAVFLFLWAAETYIQRKCSLILPSLLLAIAMSFHLLSGFLIPSLLYLFFLAYKRGQINKVIASVMIITAVLAADLIFFSFYGLPVENLWKTSMASGTGGRYTDFLVAPNLDYYFQMVNLLFLLAPFFIFILPLAAFRRIEFSENNIYMLTAISGMLIMFFGWKAHLGVYQDWNLFAITALPISLFVSNNFKKIPHHPFWDNISLTAEFVFSFHSLVWIISNHFLQ